MNYYINNAKQAWENLDEAWRVAIIAFLIMRSFYGIWSWAVLIIEPAAVHYVDVDRKPAVIFLDLYTAKIYTYYREVNGQILQFRPAGKNTVTDSQTGSLWNIQTGRSTHGEEKGINLL